MNMFFYSDIPRQTKQLSFRFSGILHSI